MVAPTDAQSHQLFLKSRTFGPFVLDRERNVLSADGTELHIATRAVALLGVLVERRGGVVTKSELLDAIWPHEDVGESSVTQAVYVLRKELRRHGLGEAIVTVPWRGYRFDAAVGEVAPPTTIAVPPPSPRVQPSWVAAVLTLAAACAIAVVPSAHTPPSAGSSSKASLSTRGAALYKLGRYHWNLRTTPEFARARAMFADVTRSDPRSAAGYIGLADTDLMVADYGGGAVNRRRLYASARRDIAMALALEPDSAPAHASRGMLLYAADHKAAAADREFQRALGIDPTYATGHHWYGTTLIERGRYAAGTRELREALRLDPTSPATSAWLGETAYQQRHFSDAILYERIAVDLRPSEFEEMRTLGLAYELSGNLPAATAMFERLDGVTRNDRTMRAHWNATALLAEVDARAGRWTAARARLREAMRFAPRDADTAFALLALGDRARGIGIIAAFRPDAGPSFANEPRLDPIRSALPPWLRHASLI